MQMIALRAAGATPTPTPAPSPTPTATPVPLSFTQHNYATPQSPLTSVPVRFQAAQKAGDLNVVIVGWGDASTLVSSVSDSQGNLYQLAVGPTVLTGRPPYPKPFITPGTLWPPLSAPTWSP